MMKHYSKLRLVAALAFSLQVFLLSAQSNQYLHFDRVDDYVILQNGSQYFSGSNQLTITGWFWCDALAYGQGHMGFRIGSGNAEFYIIQLNNGVLECRLVTTTGLHEYVSPANTVIPQTWQHIAWVFDVNVVRLYVNGILRGSGNASGVFQGTTVPFAIGKSILGGFNFVYGGRVDEVTAWNKALTQTEIQDMMANELTGTEQGLQLYYKFNQGEPGGNNTAITHLISEIGSGTRDAELMHFALVGETSNFNGTLDPGFQAISFPQIPNKLSTDAPFAIEANATSGLEVEFQVLSGPATIDGNIVTLTGEEGQVSIQASQPGDGNYNPAIPVVNNFMVINPATFAPVIDARHPLPGVLYIPGLSPVKLAAKVTIGYPELFSVQQVTFNIDGQNIPAFDHENGYYTAWWTPTSYGSKNLSINSSSNYGAASNQNVTVNLVAGAQNIQVTAAEGVWINPGNVTQTVEAELPSFQAAFDQITATLIVSCPPGGCGPWDRLASIDARGHEGEWFEIIRYITPYGVPCQHSIDLTDYISILNGKVSFRFNCETLDNGFMYKLVLDYRAGTPAFPYSTIYQVWKNTYPFGDYANLQPVEDWSFQFPPNTQSSKLKLVSTGHGWGNNNTGNAAEFYNATHHIWVNGQQTFAQHNWNICNPNPDGCQPQNGTWWHNRAGWCPGAIAPWFNFDITQFVGGGDINLGYVFFEQYVDLCHPNHPDCITGVTCPDCMDGYNPVLEVACNLVVFSGSPFVGVSELEQAKDFMVKPNPSSGIVDVLVSGTNHARPGQIKLYNMSGLLVHNIAWNGRSTTLDFSKTPKGIYMLVLQTPDHREVKKLILH